MQKDILLNGEGDAWFRRNKDGLEKEKKEIRQFIQNGLKIDKKQKLIENS